MRLQKVLEAFARAVDEHYGRREGTIEVVIPADIYDEFHDEYMKEAVYRSPTPRLDAPVPSWYVFRSNRGNLIGLRRQEGT